MWIKLKFISRYRHEIQNGDGLGSVAATVNQHSPFKLSYQVSDLSTVAIVKSMVMTPGTYLLLHQQFATTYYLKM